MREVDLTDRSDRRTLIDEVRPDWVFHLASRVTGSRDLALVGPTFDANLASSVYLMEAAAAAGTRRFVTAGSLEEPERDDAPCSPYVTAKATAALYARLYARDGQLDVRHARIAMVYGPGQPVRSKLVPSVVDALLAGRSPRIGSGARLADWVYVDDVVEALVRLAAVEIGIGGVDDAFARQPTIGTGRLHSVRDVVERLVALHGRDVDASFGAVPDRPHERAAAADAASTMAAIGWRARVGLDEGLERTLRLETARRASRASSDPVDVVRHPVSARASGSLG